MMISVMWEVWEHLRAPNSIIKITTGGEVCVCVFVGRCPEGEESNVCELVVVERKYSKSRMLMSTSRVGGQIGFALGNGT